MHAVVLTWNGAHLLPECLRALRRQDARVRLHIVVVDNASTDGTAALLACDFPDVEHLRLPENMGYSRGNNEAMRRALDAGADFVALINNDVELAPDWLRILLDGARAHPEVGLLTGTLLFRGEEVVNSTGLQIDALGLLGLIACLDDQLERRAEAAGRLEIAGRGNPLCRRLIRTAGGAKGLGCDPTRGKGGIPRALELVERGQLPLGLGELEHVAALVVGIGSFAPRSDCFAEITAQLCVLAESVECDEPGRLFSLRPELNSPVHGTRGVTVRV